MKTSSHSFHLEPSEYAFLPDSYRLIALSGGEYYFKEMLKKIVMVPRI